MEVKVNYEELESFLDYLLDKTEDCYKKEVESAIENYLKELKGVK